MKSYKKETVLIAVGLFDRYLSRLATIQTNKEAVDLVLLITVCLMLAAKLNEPMSPCLDNIVPLIQKPNSKYEKQHLIDLEFKVVSRLQFDLQVIHPAVFTGRYLPFFVEVETANAR